MVKRYVGADGYRQAVARKGRRVLRQLGLGAVLSLCAAQARADGFALNRFEPSESGSRWIAADSLNFSGHLRPAVGVVSDWAHKPLVAYSQTGEEVGVLAKNQLFLHARASMTLADRARVGISAPMLVYQNGSDQVIDGDEYRIQKEASLGDVRLTGDLGLVGRERDPLRVAVGLAAYLPTGSSEHFAGEGSVRLQPRVQVAGDIGRFAYAGRTGVLVRTKSKTFAGESMGSELVFGAAAGMHFFDDRLLVGPVIVASTVVSEGSNSFLDRQTTPFEAQLSANYDLTPDVRIGTGVGPGLSRGVGAPAARWVLSAEWNPSPKRPPKPALPLDSDGDLIADESDACPRVFGVATAEPATHGCPAPADADGDGIVDPEDACVSEPGVASPSDPAKHGCPLPADGDGDGIVDLEDACPAEAGSVNTLDPSQHGCPAPSDLDRDGIVDADDACPKDAGEFNVDRAKHGCPKAIVTADNIQIMDRVEFESGEAVLRDDAEEVLAAVVAVLQSNPQITRVSVEGHTDNRGGLGINRELSARRAAAVVSFLVERGVAPERLVSRGWGPDRPIDTNDTAEGRRNNRRVEFRLLEIDGEPAGESSPEAAGAQ